MTAAALRTSSAAVHRAASLSHTLPRISESLFITTSMDDHVEVKRTEQNLFARSGSLKRNLRSTYCIEVTDRHEASRGLSATAGLLLPTAGGFCAQNTPIKTRRAVSLQ